MTIILDQARGLQAGDAVYSGTRHIGRVDGLRSHGRRVAIDLSLSCDLSSSCEDHPLVSPDSEFYLWQDLHQANRKSLKVAHHVEIKCE